MASRSLRLTAVVAAVALAIGACGDDEVDDPSTSSGVEVSDAWARSSPAGVTAGAAYVTIESAADDQLLGVAVSPDVAATVELHETVAGDGQDADDTAGDMGDMEGHDMAATDGTSSAMTMRQVSAVELAAGEAVTFEPGGLHVMLLDLAGPLESGSSFELTLTFATAEPQAVTVEIRDEAP